MTEHPFNTLLREKALAEQSSDWWRKTAVAASLGAVLCMAIAAGTIFLGTKMAKELLMYQDNCIQPSAATQLLLLTEKVSQINDMCLESQKRHKEVLRKNLPNVYLPDHIWGALEEDGEDYGAKTMSAMPTNQAGPGFLQGQGPF